jgi:protein phosphatase
LINFFRALFSNRKINLSCFGRTDTGKVRQHNEDSFALRPDQNLYLVADGMGGHKGGEIASRLAIEEVIAAIPITELKKSRFSPEACRHLLLEGFRKANDIVLAYGQNDSEIAGLGCTLIGCLIMGNQAHICHVGDVRAYLIKDNSLVQVTSDHSLAAMTSGNDESQPKNIVTRCIGVSHDNSPDYHLLELGSQDQLLFCSDGLWNMVDDDTIFAIISKAQTPESACNQLINQANNAGGRDNITAVILKVD